MSKPHSHVMSEISFIAENCCCYEAKLKVYILQVLKPKLRGFVFSIPAPSLVAMETGIIYPWIQFILRSNIEKQFIVPVNVLLSFCVLHGVTLLLLILSGFLGTVQCS